MSREDLLAIVDDLFLSVPTGTYRDGDESTIYAALSTAGVLMRPHYQIWIGQAWTRCENVILHNGRSWNKSKEPS